MRGGHPWIFDASITSVSEGAAAGDLAVVFDHDRDFLAIGLYDPDSPIRVRVLHHGSPTPIDDGWWRARLATSLERRRPLVDAGVTTGYRCVHGENDGLPGLVVDRYDRTYVIKVYTAAWLAHLDPVVAALAELVEPDSVVLRLGRQVPGDDGVALRGAVPEGPVRFLEQGLTFAADVVRGQKTGHFLDQRENRTLVGTMTARARVLDVFSCTGGFSAHAAAGGAVAVTSVDQSSAALAAATRNMTLNTDRPTVAGCFHDVEVGDAFDVLAKMARRRRRFEVVVIDPPSFASRQSSVAAALHAYGRLTTLALDVLEPGGLLVQASCSSRVTADGFGDTVFRAARAAGHRLTTVARTGHPLDHPVGFPEGAYLKAIFARVTP